MQPVSPVIDEAIVSAVVERASARSTTGPLRSVEPLRLDRRLVTHQSHVYFYREPSPRTGGVVAKVIHGTNGGTLARREAQRLRELATHFRLDDGLRVPRVLDCEPAHALVVTEEVRGVRLDELFRQTLRRGRSSVAALEQAISLSGAAARWLSRLHDIRVACDTGCDALLEQRLQRALERLDGIAGPDWRRREVLRYFSAMIDRLPPVRPVLHHPDYSPYNMIVSDHELYVLDVAEVEVGHPVEDTAFWWAYFEWLRLLPWVDSRRVVHVQRAFLDALGLETLDRAWMRWGMLQRFSYMIDVPRTGVGGAVRNAWQRLWRRRMASWIHTQDWSA